MEYMNLSIEVLKNLDYNNTNLMRQTLKQAGFHGGDVSEILYLKMYLLKKTGEVLGRYYDVLLATGRQPRDVEFGLLMIDWEDFSNKQERGLFQNQELADELTHLAIPRINFNYESQWNADASTIIQSMRFFKRTLDDMLELGDDISTYEDMQDFIKDLRVDDIGNA